MESTFVGKFAKRNKNSKKEIIISNEWLICVTVCYSYTTCSKSYIKISHLRATNN